MDISEDGLLRSQALCRKHTRKAQGGETRCHAGFFPNYPILGIGLNGGHCLSFNCAELPRSKRILEATGYRYPVAFSMGACRAQTSRARRCRHRDHELALLLSGIAATGLRHRFANTATTCHAACHADLRHGHLQTIHKLRAIGIASKMLAHCVSRPPARCRNCIVRRGDGP